MKFTYETEKDKYAYHKKDIEEKVRNTNKYAVYLEIIEALQASVQALLYYYGINDKSIETFLLNYIIKEERDLNDNLKEDFVPEVNTAVTIFSKTKIQKIFDTYDDEVVKHYFVYGEYIYDGDILLNKYFTIDNFEDKIKFFIKRNEDLEQNCERLLNSAKKLNIKYEETIIIRESLQWYQHAIFSFRKIRMFIQEYKKKVLEFIHKNTLYQIQTIKYGLNYRFKLEDLYIDDKSKHIYLKTMIPDKQGNWKYKELKLDETKKLDKLINRIIEVTPALQWEEYHKSGQDYNHRPQKISKKGFIEALKQEYYKLNQKRTVWNVQSDKDEVSYIRL